MEKGVYKRPIRVGELQKFVAVLLDSSTSKQSDLWDYFSEKLLRSKHTFVQKLFRYVQFQLISSCFFLHGPMEPATQERTQSLWIPSNSVVVDEPICPVFMFKRTTLALAPQRGSFQASSKPSPAFQLWWRRKGKRRTNKAPRLRSKTRFGRPIFFSSMMQPF